MGDEGRPAGLVGGAEPFAGEAVRSTDSFASLAGVSYPVGVIVSAGGVNFCVYSRNATGFTLALFDQADDAAPAQSIRLDPETNRTYRYWQVFVPAVRAGELYGYYADGPNQPDQGLAFDGIKLRVDPYTGTGNTVNACSDHRS